MIMIDEEQIVTQAPPGALRADAAGRANSVRVRPLGRAADYDEILDIQRRVWGHGEADLTPGHLFRITTRLGAILLGGYIGRRLAGFVYSFPAVFEGRPVQHSHLLAVLPEFQGRGVGKALKWAQRDRAIELGYNLITWTFDPLQARNANLNLHTLGAFTRTYWRNFYGNQEALVLGPDVKTDRFLVEWPVRSRRVARRREGPPARAIPRKSGLALAERTGNRAGSARFALPGSADLTLIDKIILAEVPRSVLTLKRNPPVIAAWQRELRRVFEHYLGNGYIVEDFIFGERCFYVLGRASAAE